MNAGGRATQEAKAKRIGESEVRRRGYNRVTIHHRGTGYAEYRGYCLTRLMGEAQRTHQPVECGE